MINFRQTLLSFLMSTTILMTPAFADDTSIRVWSFNMEGWNHQYPMETKYENFLNQKQLPDFVATQENFGPTLMDFPSALQAYSPTEMFNAYARARGGNKSPAETNAIIYNKSKWSLVPEIATIESNLHAVADFCDAYASLTCQLQTGSDGYARIITWGIFQLNSNPNKIVIFTSTHNSLAAQDQPAQQQRIAQIVNKLIEQVQFYHGKNIIPVVVMAGDYNTPNNFKSLDENLDTLMKDGKPISWLSPAYAYTTNPDSIFSNAPSSERINYFNAAAGITDHGPIAETIALDPLPLQPKSK